MLLAEAEIRNLGYRFSDAVNRGDGAAFAALWAPGGVWTIDAPMDVAARGTEALVGLFTGLIGAWRFFHQIPNQGPIFIDGETARARIGKNRH